MHPKSFHLIETMRVEADGIIFLNEHLRRLQHSAVFFGIPFPKDLQHEIAETAQQYAGAFPAKLRLLLYLDGTFQHEIQPYIDIFEAKKVIWHYPEPVDSSYPYLYHKSSNRHFYETAFSEAQSLGFREVIFTNERGELTEGSRSNLFLKQGDAILTPPLYCGVLNGIYRKYLLETLPNASEKILYPNDLESASQIWCVNALRQQEEVFI